VGRVPGVDDFILGPSEKLRKVLLFHYKRLCERGRDSQGERGGGIIGGGGGGGGGVVGGGGGGGGGGAFTSLRKTSATGNIKRRENVKLVLTYESSEETVERKKNRQLLWGDGGQR